MITFASIFSAIYLTSFFLQLGTTPIWVPLLILLLVILLFWWGLTRNQISDISEDNEAGHGDQGDRGMEVIEHAQNVEVEKKTNNTIEDVDPKVAVTADDLTVIEGIGPKISSILSDAGIETFSKLADTDSETLDKIVREDAGLRLASTGTWPRQARLAAAGEWEALQVLQDELHGGKVKK